MNREEALKASDDAIKELAQALQQGKSETLLKYLDTMSRFHRYSFGNCMLIAMQKPDAMIVAGFGRWKELHRWVKKGEKGIAILAPMVSRKKADADTEDGQEPEGQPTAVLRGFRVVYVFDVSQTEGKELEEFAHFDGDPGDKIACLEQVIRSKGIELEYVDSLGGALGMSEGGKISVLSSLPKAHQFSVLVHELAHELLHRGDRRKETTKIVRETEAEAVAYAVCRWAGLDCSTAASDYIQLYSGDERVLMQSLELIRDVAGHIITELEQLGSEEVRDVA
ncbi:MAG: hypothetical protein KF861_20140 [Planctomycetaceae bacterium]|nr:hypothetical protein [Planctomycetaceae bacterium]